MTKHKKYGNMTRREKIEAHTWKPPHENRYLSMSCWEFNSGKSQEEIVCISINRVAYYHFRILFYKELQKVKAGFNIPFFRLCMYVCILIDCNIVNK